MGTSVPLYGLPPEIQDEAEEVCEQTWVVAHLSTRPFLSLVKNYITTALARHSTEDFGRRSGVVRAIRAGALRCVACGALVTCVSFPGNPEASIKPMISSTSAFSLFSR